MLRPTSSGRPFDLARASRDEIRQLEDVLLVPGLWPVALALAEVGVAGTLACCRDRILPDGLARAFARAHYGVADLPAPRDLEAILLACRARPLVRAGQSIFRAAGQLAVDPGTLMRALGTHARWTAGSRTSRIRQLVGYVIA